MVIGETDRCLKLALPNGKVVDILNPILTEIGKWIQDEENKPESGGYIVGYQHKTGNVSLEAVSPPYSLDIKNRIHFEIKDPRHERFLKQAKRRKSLYMGVWHTHPQLCPIPSNIDWEDWKATLKNDKTGCQYIFFMIVGISQWRLWVGNIATEEITEINECIRNENGIYVKK